MPAVLIISVIVLAASVSLAADAPVPKTGQTICYDDSGASIACTGTGHDGDLKKGVAWPNPRFTDNANGTVTDNLTGLIWLKDVSCATINGTRSDKNSALTKANNLNTGQCNLSDNSSPGDWRLPNVRELESLIHAGFSYPALPNTAGTGQWTSGNPFLFSDTGIFDTYWTSTLTTLPPGDILYWSMDLGVGKVFQSNVTSTYILWPVKGESATPAPAPVPKTGQTASDPGGVSGDDGELKKGVAWPGSRLANNNDGTLTDALTGLVWLRNANCAVDTQTWAQALQAVANLNSTGAMDQTNNCGDGSNGGSHQTDWRLPNRRELLSLIDFGKSDPALPVSDFVSIGLNDLYWTSTSLQSSTFEALTLDLGSGRLSSDSKDQFHFVWAVRGEGTTPQAPTPALQGPYLLLLLDSQ
jgi:hypothetical protein